MKTFSKFLTLLAVGLLIAGCNSLVEIPPALLSSRYQLFNVFASHMVVQRDQPIRFSGTAEPNKFVQVAFADGKQYVKADDRGFWTATFPARPGSFDALTLTVTGAEGVAPVAMDDILVGEVWLCCGQSNMEMPLDGERNGWRVKNYAEEVKAADYPNIRLFDVTNARTVAPYAPQNKVPFDATWKLCTPETAKKFSASGYFFGRQLQKDLNVPVGLISVAWGGTRIEPWISREGFERGGRAKELQMLNQVLNLQNPNDYTMLNQGRALKNFANFNAWQAKVEANHAADLAKLGDWTMPDFEQVEIVKPEPKFNYLLAAFELPATWQNQALTVSFDGAIDTAYVNGSKVAVTQDKQVQIPADLVKSGKNLLAFGYIGKQNADGVVKIANADQSEIVLTGISCFVDTQADTNAPLVARVRGNAFLEQNPDFLPLLAASPEGTFQISDLQLALRDAIPAVTAQKAETKPLLDAAWDKTRKFDDKLDGIMAFRAVVEVPPGWAGQNLTLRLGAIDDTDVTYFNGVQVGTTNIDTKDFWCAKRLYSIPGKLVRAGKNLIAVKVFDFGGGGGLTGEDGEITLTCNSTQESIRIDNWRGKVGLVLDRKTDGHAPSTDMWPNFFSSQFPSTLFNAMLAPFRVYPVRGMIWYQGCSNGGETDYYDLLKIFINDVRCQWKNSQMPFIIAQLAGYYSWQRGNWPDNYWQTLPPKDPNNNTGMVVIREIQGEVAKVMPHVGLATAIDIGEQFDIHPGNKQEIGRRMAKQAEKLIGATAEIVDGPQYDSFSVEADGKVRVRFTNPGGGLKTGDGQAPGAFMLTGKDGKQAWAQAVIDGETIVVSAEGITEPVAVSYGWAAYRGDVNVYNNADYPLLPFRSDVPDFEKKKQEVKNDEQK